MLFVAAGKFQRLPFSPTMVDLSKSRLTKSIFGGLFLSPSMDSLSKFSFANYTFCGVSIIMIHNNQICFQYGAFTKSDFADEQYGRCKSTVYLDRKKRPHKGAS